MTLYALVKRAVEGLQVGQVKSIKKPENIQAFRKFLSDLSNKEQKKFTTKVVKNRLHILRTEFYSMNAAINDQ